MAFFPDLSPHTYTPTRGLDVLNIGWLDEGHPFPVGQPTQAFRDALADLCKHPILLHRGSHACWFCRGRLQKEAGNGQVRVLGGRDVWYSAPILVHHYVTQHEYRPPAEFIEAVLSPVAVGADFGWFENH